MGKALIVAALLALAGCQTGGGSFCDIASPWRVRQSVQDAMSAAELAELLAFNETGQRLCHWKP